MTGVRRRRRSFHAAEGVDTARYMRAAPQTAGDLDRVDHDTPRPSGAKGGDVVAVLQASVHQVASSVAPAAALVVDDAIVASIRPASPSSSTISTRWSTSKGRLDSASS